MKKYIILIGDKASKRLMFFDKAIDKSIYGFMCMDWNNLDLELLKKADFVKIEPPTLESTSVESLETFIDWYYSKLEILMSLKGVRYLNSPKSIMDCLDKAYTKNVFQNKGVVSTEMLGYDIKNYDEFRSLLVSKNLREAFVKPRFGSGACGIVVYRYNPKTSQEIIYTTMGLGGNGELLNCKSINMISDKEKIKNLINAICKVGVIVERWERKAKCGELSYDLRVVYQFGKVEYIIARGSNGPITNLHLNNKPIIFDNLNFSDVELKEIENICKKAVECFKGLNVAGVDILVTPKRQFKVIEINSQGDLIYADIKDKNIIYRNQVNNIKNISLQ